MSGGILFLEDDEAQMIIYKRLASNYFPNLSFFFANTVSDAEEILKYNSIKLAVLDLMIPVTNGADLIMKMKADSIYQGVKIIVVTAAEKGSLLYDALGGVVEEFVTKPINAQRFVDLLTRYIQSQGIH